MLDEQTIQIDMDRLIIGLDPTIIFSYFGHVGDDVIDAAEVAVGLPFPLDYRIFLRRYGVGIFQQFNIHGLFSEEAYFDFAHLDVSERTVTFRDGLLLPNVIPEKVISVSSDHDNVQFFFDYNAATDGDAPIFAVSGYFGPTFVAATFLEFLQLLFRNSPSPDPFNLYQS